MSGLRIMFEVDEKHVGACLVALEGRAKNLNFEVIREGDWKKNGRGPQKAKNGKLGKEFVLAVMKDFPAGAAKESLLAAVRQAGYKSQGLNSIMLSLVKKKLVKKVGGAWLLVQQ